MTKTIKICDKCNKEVEWLYKVPWVHIEGLRVAVDEGKTELCIECMTKLMETMRNFHKTK